MNAKQTALLNALARIGQMLDRFDFTTHKLGMDQARKLLRARREITAQLEATRSQGESKQAS